MFQAFRGGGDFLVSKGHATGENGSCAAIFGMLRCRNCTATLAFLQCGSHLDQKLRCSKRKTALEHRKSCICRKVALSCRFPAGFKPPRLGTHVSDLLKFPTSADGSWSKRPRPKTETKMIGGSLFTFSWSFLLTAELVCLQSL